MNTKKCSDEEILNAIIEFIQLYSYSPSTDELLVTCGYYSSRTLRDRLARMRDKGLIDYVDGLPRTITVPGFKYVKCDI